MKPIFTIERVPAWLIYALTFALAIQLSLNVSLLLLLPETTGDGKSTLLHTRTGTFDGFSCRKEKAKHIRRVVLTINSNIGTHIDVRIPKVEDCNLLSKRIRDIDQKEFSLTKIRFGWYFDNAELLIGDQEFLAYKDFVKSYREMMYVSPFFFVIAIFICFLKYKRIYHYKGLRI